MKNKVWLVITQEDLFEQKYNPNSIENENEDSEVLN